MMRYAKMLSNIIKHSLINVMLKAAILILMADWAYALARTRATAFILAHLLTARSFASLRA